MHENVVDIVATDLAVTALAGRVSLEAEQVGDPALRLLRAWAADIDAHPNRVDLSPVSEGAPIPETVMPETVAARSQSRRRPRGTVRSVAAMTIALTLSSTGIAAAVQGNPFAPINYVVDRFGHLGHLGQHDRSSPVDLFGSRGAQHTDAGSEQSRDRAESAQRPSRSADAERPARAAAPGGVDNPRPGVAITAHKAPHSRGSGPSRQHKPQTEGQTRRHRHHGPLVVQSPHPPPVESPTPSGGETPPNRPEPPSGDQMPSWPRPGTGDGPAPPDQPMPSGLQTAPVR